MHKNDYKWAQALFLIGQLLKKIFFCTKLYISISHFNFIMDDNDDDVCGDIQDMHPRQRLIIEWHTPSTRKTNKLNGYFLNLYRCFCQPVVC